MPVSLRAILLSVRHSDFRTSLRQALKNAFSDIIIFFSPAVRLTDCELYSEHAEHGFPAPSSKEDVPRHRLTPLAQWQTPSTGLRHPSLEEGAGKRCSECGSVVHTHSSEFPPPPPPPPRPAPAPRSPDAAYLAGSISDFVRVGKNEATDVHFAPLCLR